MVISGTARNVHTNCKDLDPYRINLKFYFRLKYFWLFILLLIITIIILF